MRDAPLVPWSTCRELLSQSMARVGKEETENWFNKQPINVPMPIHPDPGFVPMGRFPEDENGLVLWTASMEHCLLITVIHLSCHGSEYHKRPTAQWLNCL